MIFVFQILYLKIEETKTDIENFEDMEMNIKNLEKIWKSVLRTRNWETKLKKIYKLGKTNLNMKIEGVFWEFEDRD